MKKLIFIVGGARSGKSTYAVRTAKIFGNKIVYLATCDRSDAEMTQRIRRHKRTRPSSWKTVVEGKDLAAVLRREKRCDAVLIDCLGLWISNLLGEELGDKEIELRLAELISALRNRACAVLFVSNDVGSGIVPDNELARRFRDIVGTANQKLAGIADEVIFMQAGIPIRIKGGA